MHEGHRKRMLERAKNDLSDLQDHELLEVILYGVLPRVNTNPIAHELISEFGDLGGVLSADCTALQSVQGVGPAAAAYLCCIGEICNRKEKREEAFPQVKSYRDLQPFIVSRLCKASREILEIYCLDCKFHVKAVRQFAQGGVDRASADPEALILFFATQRPFGVVAAHNHPDGPCRPSEADDRFTRQLQLICSMNNAVLYDHVIVTPDGQTYSYFRNGKIDEFRDKYTFNRLLEYVR